MTLDRSAAGSSRRDSNHAKRRLRDVPTVELFDGIRDTLSDAHRGPGTANGEPLDGCPGCWAQAALDELAYRIASDFGETT